MLNTNGGKFPFTKKEIILKGSELTWKYRKKIGRALPKQRWRTPGY